eukprot:403368786
MQKLNQLISNINLPKNLNLSNINLPSFSLSQGLQMNSNSTSTNPPDSSIGQTVTIGHRTVKIDRKISEGGYAFVYQVSDVNTYAQYALKKLAITRQLGEHENIVRFIDASMIKDGTGSYIMILSELCTQGTLFDVLTKYDGKLSEQGLQLMHTQSPPIAHRDLKIENVLLQNKRFKLCDFGSASTSTLDQNQAQLSQNQIDEVMEEFEKYTTMMYRPPEMIDKYKKYRVDTQADIWMLGCVAFTLCFFQHPFQESQRLGIINAHFYMPNDTRISEKMKNFIRLLLVPNPSNRPKVNYILNLLNKWQEIQQIPLSAEAQHIKQRNEEEKQEDFSMQSQVSSKQGGQAGDLTADDIVRLQEKLRRESQAQQVKKKQHVPLPSSYSQTQMNSGIPQQQQQQLPQQRQIHQSQSQQINNFDFNFQSAQNSSQQSKNNYSTQTNQDSFFSWEQSQQSKQNVPSLQVGASQQQIKVGKQAQGSSDWFFDFNAQQQQQRVNSSNNGFVPQSQVQTTNLLEIDSQPLINHKSDMLCELQSLDFGSGNVNSNSNSNNLLQHQPPQNLQSQSFPIGQVQNQQQNVNDFFNF